MEIEKDSRVAIQSTYSAQEWNSYVSAHPGANIHHLAEWSAVIERSFGYKRCHLIAKNPAGKICGILPLLLVKSPITGSRLVSLPFSYTCGPLADSHAILDLLLREAQELCSRLKCRYLEIKTGGISSSWLQRGFKPDEQFSTFVLDLSPGENVKELLDPSIRRGIRKATKDGVAVRKTANINDLESFYRLNLRNKRKLGVPGHPLRFLTGIFNLPDKTASLYLAEIHGQTIAGVITLKYNKTVLYGYGASEEKHLIHRPNNLLLWTAIEDSIKEGYRFFDFGRTSPGEAGLTEFKKRWGTEEKTLGYYYYPGLPDLISRNNTGAKYRLITGLWKRLPFPVVRTGSEIVFKHLG